MTTYPLISVLIPVLNGAVYLSDCLDSILSQTIQSWECIVVDDHSTDQTWEILQEYQDCDPRIKCYRSEGRGITPALRTAYQMSRGDYLTRMDADDLMLPQKLSILLEGCLRSGPGYLAIGGVQYFSESGVGDGYKGYAEWLNGLTRSGNNWADLYKECVIPSPSWMLVRADMDRCGAFDSDRYPEDYDLAFRMYAAGLKVIACQQILHKWRDYPQRTSRNDPNYADNRFLELKLHWFTQLESVEGTHIVLWGAGKKGKQIATHLIDTHVDLTWVTDNPKKVGKDIYGHLLTLPRHVDYTQQVKVIVSVANPIEQQEIVSILESHGLVRGQQYYLFC